MATAVLDKPRPRRLTVVASLVFATAVIWGKRLTAPKSASLATLRKMPLTVAGIGCIDTGAFLGNSIVGWIITGLSLMILEYMIADES